MFSLFKKKRNTSRTSSFVAGLFIAITIFTNAAPLAHANFLTDWLPSMRNQDRWAEIITEEGGAAATAKSHIDGGGDPSELPAGSVEREAAYAYQKDRENLATAKALAQADDCQANLLSGLTVLLKPQCWIGGAFSFIGDILLKLAKWFVVIAGLFLDWALFFSIDSTIYNTPGVIAGWEVLRDTVNMFFIFILLYVAFMTILQINTANTKRIVVATILVAIFLNFSHFLTTAFIDVGNALGASVYSSFRTAYSNQTGGSTPISDALTKSLDISSTLDEVEPERIPGYSLVDEGFVKTLTSVALVIAGFVLLAGGFMFLFRTAFLVLLIVSAPVAFVAIILPQTRRYWSQWVGHLVSNTFILPVYLLLLTIVVAFTQDSLICNYVSAVGDCTDRSLAGAFNPREPGSSNFAVLLQYGLVIALLIAVQKISKGMMGGVATYSSKLAGAATFGTLGFAGRQSVGRSFTALRDSEYLKNMEAKGGISAYGARAAMRLSDKGANASFDARNTAPIRSQLNTGSGTGKGGYSKIKKDSQKWYEDRADDMGKSNITNSDKVLIETKVEESSEAEKARLAKAKRDALLSVPFSGRARAASQEKKAAEEALKEKRGSVRAQELQAAYDRADERAKGTIRRDAAGNMLDKEGKIVTDRSKAARADGGRKEQYLRTLEGSDSFIGSGVGAITGSNTIRRQAAKKVRSSKSTVADIKDALRKAGELDDEGGGPSAPTPSPEPSGGDEGGEK